jgi:hypothetical protein
MRSRALEGDVSLRDVKTSTASSFDAEIARYRGALLLDTLRREMGDEKFLALMRDFYAANTTKKVATRQFADAAGPDRRAFFETWLGSRGLPGDKGGAMYAVTDFGERLGNAIIVYGTGPDAGANRYAAEQLRNRFLDWFEGQLPLLKDFEAGQADLRDHDVLFVGRPESNSALAALAQRLGVRFEGASFRVAGKDYASERNALWLAASNPLNPRRMVLVLAGNSALETVRAASLMPDAAEYTVYETGKSIASGFLPR